MIIGFTKRDGSVDFQDICSLRLIREGPELTTWLDDSNREHFFDKDGYYDGWGEPFGRKTGGRDA